MNRVVFFGDHRMNVLRSLYAHFVAGPRGEDAAFISGEQPVSAASRDLIGSASLVVAQVSGSQTKPAIERPAGSCAWHIVPAVNGGFLWPFGGQPHPRNHPDRKRFPRRYSAAFGDAYLNRMIHEGIEPLRAADKYLAVDVAKLVDLDRLFALTIAAQRRRDELTGYDFAETIARHFRSDYLFLTSFHPTRRLMSVMAREVFQRIGVDRTLLEEIESRFDEIELPAKALPIHPSVIRHFQLSFVSESQRYAYAEEGSFTFGEYAVRYMQFGAERSSGPAAGLAETAFLLAAQDRTEEAIAAMDKASAIEANADWHNRLSRTLVRRGKLVEAEQEIRKALALAPDHALHHREFSHILSRQHRIDDAIAAAAKSVELAADDPRNRFHLALLLMHRGDLAQAEGEFRRAIACDPDNGLYHAELSRLLMKCERATEASEEARRAVALEPDNAQCHLQLAEVLVHVGELKPAETEFLSAIALNPKLSAAHAKLGQLLVRLERADEALISARKAVALAPDNAHLRASLANMLIAAGKFEDAESEMAQAVSLAPDIAAFHGGLSNIMVRQNRIEEALHVARKAAELDASNPSVRAHLGRILIRAHRFSEAEQEIREAIRLAPAHASSHTVLSHLLLQQNRIADAVAAARTAADLDPGNAQARAHLESLLVRMRGHSTPQNV